MKPTIKIDYLVHQKVMHWVNGTNYEVSGLGKLVVEKNEIRVIDAMLLPQKNTAGSTDIEPEDVCRAMFELRDTPGELRWWWHSHVNMGVFWSGTDTDTMDKLASQGWFLSTVFNKKWEYRTALKMGKPLEILLDELPTTIHHSVPAGLTEAWDAEFKKNVTNVSHARAGWEPEGQIWDYETSAWVTFRSLSKKDKKRIRKQQSASKASNQIWPQIADTPEEDEGCPLCGMIFACECPKEDKIRAQELDKDGRCFVCSALIDYCHCTDWQLQNYFNTFKPKFPPSRVVGLAARKAPPAAGKDGSTGGVY